MRDDAEQTTDLQSHCVLQKTTIDCNEQYRRQTDDVM